MADEARAMLDALMGADRDAGFADEGDDDGRGDGGYYNGGVGGGRRKRRSKRSCYDHDVCPLYCAWGVDLFDLFKNTKSDLGSNSYIVDDDARQEYLSLPDHEKERLGYDMLLFRKLGDLVRGCNRIVSRNNEKLKVELAKTARQRSEGKNEAIVMDIAQYVDSEHLAKCAENVANLELYEEELHSLLTELQSLQEQKQSLLSKKTNSDNNDDNNDKDTEGSVENSKEALLSNLTNDPLVTKKEVEGIVKKQQVLLTKITQLVCDYVHPLRETTENQKRQLYYVRSDTTSDKTVCEVSGNFMSSRDADERIAAHYAGKQYVGWKMVRAKWKQMTQQYGKLNSRGGPPPPQPPHYRNNNGPPPYGAGPYSTNAGYQGPPPPRYRERSRSRDRDEHSRYYRGRRSPSPARWERDRGGGGPGHSRGYDRGHHHHHRSANGGGTSHHRSRRRDRDRRR